MNHSLVFTIHCTVWTTAGGDYVQPEPLPGIDYVQCTVWTTSWYWLCMLYSLNYFLVVTMYSLKPCLAGTMHSTAFHVIEVGSGFGSRSSQVKSSEFNLIHIRIHNMLRMQSLCIVPTSLCTSIYLCPLSTTYIKCLSPWVMEPETPATVCTVELLHVFSWTREYWMIYKKPGFLAVLWFGSSPTPPPHFPPLQWTSCLSFSVFLCVDSEKAWPCINHSILSELNHWQTVCCM